MSMRIGNYVGGAGEYISLRQQRLNSVKEEVHRPVDEENVKRALHHEGFNYDDVTKVEKIDLFI